MKVTPYVINKGTSSEYWGLKSVEDDPRDSQVLHTPKWKSKKSAIKYAEKSGMEVVESSSKASRKFVVSATNISCSDLTDEQANTFYELSTFAEEIIRNTEKDYGKKLSPDGWGAVMDYAEEITKHPETYRMTGTDLDSAKMHLEAVIYDIYEDDTGIEGIYESTDIKCSSRRKYTHAKATVPEESAADFKSFLDSIGIDYTTEDVPNGVEFMYDIYVGSKESNRIDKYLNKITSNIRGGTMKNRKFVVSASMSSEKFYTRDFPDVKPGQVKVAPQRGNYTVFIGLSDGTIAYQWCESKVKAEREAKYARDTIKKYGSDAPYWAAEGYKIWNPKADASTSAKRRFSVVAARSGRQKTVVVVQEYTGYGNGWEDVAVYDDASSESWKDAKATAKDYRDNGYSARVIERRVDNPDYVEPESTIDYESAIAWIQNECPYDVEDHTTYGSDKNYFVKTPDGRCAFSQVFIRKDGTVEVYNNGANRTKKVRSIEELAKELDRIAKQRGVVASTSAKRRFTVTAAERPITPADRKRCIDFVARDYGVTKKQAAEWVKEYSDDRIRTLLGIESDQAKKAFIYDSTKIGKRRFTVTASSNRRAIRAGYTPNGKNVLWLFNADENQWVPWGTWSRDTVTDDEMYALSHRRFPNSEYDADYNYTDYMLLPNDGSEPDDGRPVRASSAPKRKFTVKAASGGSFLVKTDSKEGEYFLTKSSTKMKTFWSSDISNANVFAKKESALNKLYSVLQKLPENAFYDEDAILDFEDESDLKSAEFAKFFITDSDGNVTEDVTDEVKKHLLADEKFISSALDDFDDEDEDIDASIKCATDPAVEDFKDTWTRKIFDKTPAGVSTITVYFKDGRSANYTTEVFEDMTTDSSVDYIIDAETGELLYESENGVVGAKSIECATDSDDMNFYEVDLMYERDGGFEDSGYFEDWSDAENFAHNGLMRGFWVRIIYAETGDTILISPDEYNEAWENGSADFDINDEIVEFKKKIVESSTSIECARGYFADDINNENVRQALVRLCDNMKSKYNDSTIGDVSIRVDDVKKGATSYFFVVRFEDSDNQVTLFVDTILNNRSSSARFKCEKYDVHTGALDTFEIPISGSRPALENKIEEIANDMQAKSDETDIVTL